MKMTPLILDLARFARGRSGCLVWFAAVPLLAAPLPVWQIGVDEDPFAAGYIATDEFSSENYLNDPRPGKVTRLPGDPLYNAGTNPTADDDFYFSGTYPIGFNNLATNLPVPNPEPNLAFERALTDGDRTNRVHFFLTAEQAGALSRLRLSFELVGGGIWFGAPINQSGESFGSHNVTVRFLNSAGQGTLIYSNRVDRDTRIILNFPATNGAASAGPNTIEIARVGPITPNVGYWIQFDYVALEADTNALADVDADGLPRWWEEDNGLSDANPADALSDNDGDGRTAWQEYNAGSNSSNPNRADTDGDGLRDGAEFALGTNPNHADTDGDSISDRDEVNGSPVSNPLLPDSDGDGDLDSLERRVGTNPLSAASLPTIFRGGIGIHFVSQGDLNGTLDMNETAGIIPQTRWSDTLPIRTWTRPAGSKADILTPLTNQVVRSDGAIVTNFTFNWTGDASDASDNGGSPDRRLMSGFIRAYGAIPASLTLSNITFTNFDLYVIVGGSYDGQKGRVRLGADPTTDRFFRTTATAPQSDFVLIKPGTNFQSANFVQYTNLTSSNLTINVTNYDGWALGIHAVQIVDRNLDSDSSGIPDWYEMKYALQPGSPTLAAADLDGDGLSNLQEFQRGTDPRKSDTDGEGLSDLSEGYSSTNPLDADSDGDGLSDYAEVNAPMPTNPNLADTDGDGVRDRTEVLRGTDATYNPASSATFVSYVPFFRSGPARWEWNLENVQLVWDHGAGALAPNIWNEDELISFAAKNPATTDWRTFGMSLRYYNGGLTHLFHSEVTGGFSYPSQPNSTIWDSDYGNPPADLKSKLGFSGYGPADISDRLQFRLFAQRGANSNAWTVTFAITNQTSNTLVVLRTFNNCTARSPLDNGTAPWTDYNGITNLASMVVHQGVKLFLTTNVLENLPAFASAKDSDNDGMPDVWEDANQFNKLSSADATQDADADGLNNRDEFLAGTNPRLADTDGDGINDLIERTNSSNPLLITSKPELAGQTWPTGPDLDGNGLPDAWEVRFRAFGLSPNTDADGDGASNAQEAKWGTDPLDANSKIALTFTRQSQDAFVSWPQQAAKDQRLFSSTTLTNWTQFGGVTWLSSGTVFAVLTNRMAQSNQEFYRVTTDDKDTDGDGVKDWAEAVLGSDPLRASSLHAAMPIINSTGAVTGSVFGDYAAFVEQMRGGPSGGATGGVTRAQAARLLQQATFGPTWRELDRVQQLGFAAWVDDQITTQPATLHREYLEQVYADFNGSRTDLTYSFNDMDQFINGNNATTPFARAAIAGPDQLRQRVAFALSQICVASRRDANLENRPLGMADFYDIFVRNAFGNYGDVLREVTLHPVMGRYLSHVGNQKARPEINQYPDENYAREVQQLFSIGLWELHPDGTRKLDSFGRPIPTYGNAQITEFARVFTGLWFGGQAWGNGGWTDDDSSVPMQMWAEKHDFGAKTLLNGFTIPARVATVENGLRDVDDALRNLFGHPNTGPFIGKQLIQFLVTSNPSSNYVARIAATFANNGSGHRGDLAAVVTAILLDAEARDMRWSQGAPEFGRLKEPVYRAMAIARAGNLARHPNLLWWTWGEFYAAAFQEPTYSPSVFNFFRPNYQPPGLLTANGLLGPAFQITDSYSSISFPNKLWEITQTGLTHYGDYGFAPDYAELVSLAGDAGALADQVNLLFCGGAMSAATRDKILNGINQIASYDRLARARLAVYLGATCPEGAVQR
ncbi:MAG: DUF1800 family protein [Verrucomicrobia bacterium]|nr:DUF1800 family protein [Verrucomicrobiota bacterium]